VLQNLPAMMGNYIWQNTINRVWQNTFNRIWQQTIAQIHHTQKLLLVVSRCFWKITLGL